MIQVRFSTSRKTQLTYLQIDNWFINALLGNVTLESGTGVSHIVSELGARVLRSNVPMTKYPTRAIGTSDTTEDMQSRHRGPEMQPEHAQRGGLDVAVAPALPWLPRKALTLLILLQQLDRIMSLMESRAPATGGRGIELTIGAVSTELSASRPHHSRSTSTPVDDGSFSEESRERLDIYVS